MARRKKTRTKTVETIRHQDASRKNLPSAEHQPLMQAEERSPLQVAYERRNRDLDPQLVWRGKDTQDWSELVVNAPPLYIQERVHPKVLIDDLMRQSERARRAESQQPGFADLFADFNGLPSEEAKTEFYRHDANWSNRMILGDSLRVMASLAEREGLRGKVQCIYIDPPYGIRFNSNFQWSTTSRDVRDGKADHITREPEQVKAFRDTWRDGIHSYLAYLRDRLAAARDLLTESGSIFVQIGDENAHRVRAVMDEVFGEENFVSQILYRRGGFQTGKSIANTFDFILWFAKSSDELKVRPIYSQIGAQDWYPNADHWVEFPDGNRIAHSLKDSIPAGVRLHSDRSCFSATGGESSSFKVNIHGTEVGPPIGRGWSTNVQGVNRLLASNRIVIKGKRPRFKPYYDDFPLRRITNGWMDTVRGGFTGGGEDSKVYVVQTGARIVQRCLLMTTDPGDLVLDPTCGSGTTAYVAEQWGRRWITIDTSRVALALARARIMGARYPYYLLADSREGQLKEAEIERKAPSESSRYGDVRQGFVYQRVPHITLRAIANNAEIDVIWEDFQQRLEPLREGLNTALGTSWEEWEIPRDADEGWPDAVKILQSAWWEQRIARQKEIDASIAAKADYEYLYDKPHEDGNKVRVAGPFTVESISPHRVLAVDENDEFIDIVGESPGGYDFAEIILDNLRTAGVQQAHKEDRISFTYLMPWPGRLVCAEGRYFEGGEEEGIQRRAAIFIGPEFGTVSRPDLVAAAREAADGGFDVLIACAFNYEAHTTEFERLGSVPVLKARMNADLHMAADLKNTGQGNLFVIFGEPDITVTSGRWLVARNGRKVANYALIKELSGLGSLEEINRVGKDGLSRLCSVSPGREVRHDQSGPAGSGVSRGEHRGGIRTARDQGVSSIPGDGERFAGGDRDLSGPGAGTGDDDVRADQARASTSVSRWTDAQRAQTLAALQNLSDADFPLSLTTDHWAQVTVHGVDVFHPNTGDVRSDGPEGIACWFVDTDYNEENFFVRHAYFLGASDPYKSLKTTLKAEIDAEAWESLRSDTSRPFPKPDSGRIAVKVINHLGDEVMKVFRVT